MSIWASFGGVENCWEGVYHSERNEDWWVGLADSCYEHGQKMRLNVQDEVGEAMVALDQDQVQSLVDAMTGWLDGRARELEKAYWAGHVAVTDPADKPQI